MPALLAVNPVTEVSLDAGGLLQFRNAAADHGVAPPPTSYQATWWRFDNATGEATQSLGMRETKDTSVQAPDGLPTAPGSYIRVEVSAVSEGHPA